MTMTPNPRPATHATAAEAGEMTLNRLTPRQRDVAALVAEGLTNPAIAHRLCVCQQQAKNDLTSVFRALGIRTGEGQNARVMLARRLRRLHSGTQPQLCRWQRMPLGEA